MIKGRLTPQAIYQFDAKNMSGVRFEQFSDFNLMIGHTPLLIVSIPCECLLFCFVLF